MKSENVSCSLCPIPLEPLDCSPPGFSVHGVLQARTLERVAIPSPEGLPDPGVKRRPPALWNLHRLSRQGKFTELLDIVFESWWQLWVFLAQKGCRSLWQAGSQPPVGASLCRTRAGPAGAITGVSARSRPWELTAAGHGWSLCALVPMRSRSWQGWGSCVRGVGPTSWQLGPSRLAALAVQVRLCELRDAAWALASCPRGGRSWSRSRQQAPASPDP